MTGRGTEGIKQRETKRKRKKLNGERKENREVYKRRQLSCQAKIKQKRTTPTPFKSRRFYG